MALFALWRADVTAPRSPNLMHARLAAASHIDPAVTTATMVSTQKGLWHLSAFATRTHFYAPEDQVHLPSGGGVCIIHGLIWRADAVRPRVLHAAEIAEVLNRPDATLPDDIAGEFAIARLLPCGTLLAFSDPAGLHQLFHHDGHRDVVANRASLVATLTDTSRIDAQAGAWITTTGYRVGAATAWRGIRQLAAGHALVDGRTVPLPRRIELPPEPRGYTYGGEALLERGMAQASAAIELSVPEGAIIDLPLTGGKDSRAVLALCLRAGLRERLRTFTRGYVDSPDAIAAALLAKVVGVPHRREPPLGSDQPFDLTLDEFHENFARLAFQTDGGMGGWDMITGRITGTDTLLTGHMGEVLKAYSKRALPTELDPVALVRLQSPFDPLGILRAEARTRMVEQLAAAMAADRQGGAWEADLPDLFYLHNRIPNWLGGIRGIKSFERQPVLPLGVPALMELAFRMTPDERRAELAHYSIISAAAPELLALPFAHQKWDASLPDAPQIDPVLVPAGKPLFGNWQYSLNTRPEIRAHLSKLFSSADLELWDWIDRDAVIERLHHQKIDYFAGISLLGLTVSAYHSAGLLLTERLAAPEALTYGEAHSPPPPFRDGTMEVMW